MKDDPDYAYHCDQMTSEVLAACEGAMAAGAGGSRENSVCPAVAVCPIADYSFRTQLDPDHLGV